MEVAPGNGTMAQLPLPAACFPPHSVPEGGCSPGQAHRVPPTHTMCVRYERGSLLRDHDFTSFYTHHLPSLELFLPAPHTPQAQPDHYAADGHSCPLPPSSPAPGLGVILPMSGHMWEFIFRRKQHKGPYSPEMTDLKVLGEMLHLPFT